MQYHSAERIYQGDGRVLVSKVIAVDNNGRIDALLDRDACNGLDVQMHGGIITPGFVNTHCHLELSHMKSKVDTGTGLIPFISNVVKFRDIPQGQIDAEIKAGDQEMFEAGIVAVGDISNKADTLAVKRNSKMRYYTFVEMFDFMQSAMTESAIQQYEEVYAQHDNNSKDKKTRVPHSPYSVSRDLYKHIAENTNSQETISIHNQETPAENEMFLEGSGDFFDFFAGFGFPLKDFKGIGKTSVHNIIENLPTNRKLLLVHNSLSTPKDIEAAESHFDQVYWASCPNANMYIENILPNYKHFIEAGSKVTLGTDSLTSNWQLSILEEMKTILKYQSYLSFDTVIQWATKNGAEALGFADDLGTIEVGKKPGLVHIDAVVQGDSVEISKATSRRLDVQ